MKHIIPAIQLILLVVAGLIVVPFKGDEALLTLAWWQLIAGGLQLITGLFLTYRHWQTPFLKNAFSGYWVLVIIEFALLGSLVQYKGTLYTIILFIVPWAIAVYFTLLVFIAAYTKK